MTTLLHELDEVLTLRAKATPGPWQQMNAYQWESIIGDVDGPDEGVMHYKGVADARTRDNAALIVAAINFLHHAPELRAALELANLNELFGNSEELGWQPIETAPKDGTMIDIWNGDRVADASWQRPDGGSIDYKDWCVSVPEVNGCTVSWCMENIHPQPTHWMPLPTPPAQGEQDDAR